MSRFAFLRRARLLALAACALCGGCSYVFVTEAPANHRRLQYFDCTSSRVAPVLDTVGTGVLALSAGTYVVDPDPGDGSGEIAARVGVTLALAALAGVSAVYGYEHTARCSRAKHDLAERSTREAAPPPMPGCGADADCKGDRICVANRCVDPSPPAAPPHSPPPATTPEPPPPPTSAPAPAPASAPAPAPAPASAPASAPAPAPASAPAPAPAPTAPAPPPAPRAPSG